MMLVKFHIAAVLCQPDVLFQVHQGLVVLPLLELHELLVSLGYFQLREVLTDDVLHLHWVEVLLVSHHIPKPCLDIFNLFKLNEQHLVELFEVFLEVIICHTSVKLSHDRVDASLELTSVLSDLLVVFFVGFGVLLKPVLGVVDHLVHSLLVVLVLRLNLAIVHPGLAEELLKLQFCFKEQLLHFLDVFFVLVKLIFKCRYRFDLCFQVHFLRLNFVTALFELLLGVDGLLVQFLLLNEVYDFIMDLRESATFCSDC